LSSSIRSSRARTRDSSMGSTLAAWLRQKRDAFATKA
jgi:hypothetical protein